VSKTDESDRKLILYMAEKVAKREHCGFTTVTELAYP
jgi:hypothetical protein